ncbi:MAG: hypothetical protein US83_C0005G0023 [Candidatus Falkowbacteria bacterium GW2011_GWC2_38_22]|uniref:Uncharacterized protein n=1 Tax=Candidatus Falkowbacteria bacterium GW2011_GWE1_38_31 TaxID=1618638 RepID=A0A0G0MZT0_9BACT|nr:MAG: hypothetical protein US73_C0003G0071 [Candidatus Falkowbacteria bacterium GW2011_GWF2_38_1205]KKQ61510.1 MAG: hypothetical protein US83_C0005G0023 [Candidatus Falkowbacteria bacterium GW2011_GWC2_38_22]KKQ63597.1 MAG: hypothetical protein US84_C0005G0071 [Candidatus Falkowbacteria bacterium GW2011_GWF1_38_22]KKQ65749.1 MAG: hypothetical protein US87_C0005G0071 [Candidatus Falkowbacteria bacterium GW2011_GWE2_38_254]KKQ70366.1 MAG: hypothetical protein US91_C0005G0071 [Candidatus Falkowb
MKLTKSNAYKFLLIGFLTLVICMSVFFVIKNKKGKEALLSRVDYRIFACGEEIFLKVDNEDLKTKMNGLFARSESGSVIADGFVESGKHVFLSSFFKTVGSILEYTADHQSNLYLQTETGVREFHSEDMCNGKEAGLHLIHHRVETGTNPWSIYSRIVWKEKDDILTNNYGKVPPGDCFIFLFDSEDVLNRPWPTCASHDQALKTGELVLEK